MTLFHDSLAQEITTLVGQQQESGAILGQPSTFQHDLELLIGVANGEYQRKDTTVRKVELALTHVLEHVRRNNATFSDGFWQTDLGILVSRARWWISVDDLITISNAAALAFGENTQANRMRIVGRDLGSTVNDVKRVLAKPGLLPPGMYHELGGLYAQQQVAFHDLTVVMLAAIALVFTLLLFLYESFRVALAIMAAPLLALSAVFVGLWVTGIELNISALMGMTMIVGIVTEIAIFYFTEAADAEQRMPLPDALRYAGHHRMRPILMSTIAAILTLLPLAFALGQGSQMQQPLAVAIIAGMLVQVPLVLLVMPVLYTVLRRRGAAPAT